METNSEDYKVFYPRVFDTLSKKEFSKRNSEGYVPFYFDKKTYELVEIKLDSKFNPLDKNGRQFTNNTTNPYEHIFFLKDGGIDVVKKLTDNISAMLKAIDEQKSLYLKYPVAVVNKLIERGNK